ncbi:MAG TPA: SRPBCC domain-containing protein, partial [Gammaproteobacteria bacterium]|nr:SRPBCC domain-containing protein [Gammaproteobacteria bacterium]
MPTPAEVTSPSDREVRVTRRFNAPRQLVWDAHTKPELVSRWQGYGGWDMPVCEMDVRVGGKYRWQW